MEVSYLMALIHYPHIYYAIRVCVCYLEQSYLDVECITGGVCVKVGLIPSIKQHNYSSL